MQLSCAWKYILIFFFMNFQFSFSYGSHKFPGCYPSPLLCACYKRTLKMFYARSLQFLRNCTLKRHHENLERKFSDNFYFQVSATVASLWISKRNLKVSSSPQSPNPIYGQVTGAECFRLFFIFSITPCYQDDTLNVRERFDVFIETRDRFENDVCQPYGT